MYLSRVEIDTLNRQKTRELTHLGAFHSWVEDSFPKEQEEHIRSRKLWRIDCVHQKEYLLIVSETKPDLQQMEKFGVTGTAGTKNYDTLLDSLENGMYARFRATLNPVISLSDKERFPKRGRVVPCLSIESQMQYLFERSKKHGFQMEADDVTIVHRSREIFKKKHQKKVYLRKVTYEGRLQITDVERFKEVLKKGLGRKKAYGFGMITVIPEV